MGGFIAGDLRAPYKAIFMAKAARFIYAHVRGLFC